MTRLHKSVIALAGASAVAALALQSSLLGAQGQVREFSIDADHFAFSPPNVEVQKGDLVKITFTARDIAHSFTVDEYRIAKRAGAGQQVVIEFRADRDGTFAIYCNLTQDERCRQMKGQLVVR